MSFHSDSRQRLEQQLAFAKRSLENWSDLPDVSDDLTARAKELADYQRKEIAEIEAELADRDRAEAIPCAPFGKKVRITVQLPENPCAATPKVGTIGTSMGASPHAGRTEVRFNGADLGYLDGEPVNLYITNYAFEIIE